jgi:hypothetical protein
VDKNTAIEWHNARSRGRSAGSPRDRIRDQRAEFAQVDQFGVFTGKAERTRCADHWSREAKRLFARGNLDHNSILPLLDRTRYQHYAGITRSTPPIPIRLKATIMSSIPNR